MKYIVAVKYNTVNDDNTQALNEHGGTEWDNSKTEIFEFNSKKERSNFISAIRPFAKDYVFSQIEEKE